MSFKEDDAHPVRESDGPPGSSKYREDTPPSAGPNTPASYKLSEKARRQNVVQLAIPEILADSCAGKSRECWIAVALGLGLAEGEELGSNLLHVKPA
jgi:hypothetical protein